MRVATTVAVGVVIAAFGVGVFLYAHTLSGPLYLQEFNEAHRNLHEIRWTALGIAIWLGGIKITAVGLSSWCNNRRV